jgi:hypothetical protein
LSSTSALVAFQDRRSQQYTHRAAELRVLRGVLASELPLDLLFAGAQVQRQQHRDERDQATRQRNRDGPGFHAGGRRRARRSMGLFSR